ncbi:hypothetical protein ACFE04_007676 [Oxalis oulophora]
MVQLHCRVACAKVWKPKLTEDLIVSETNHVESTLLDNHVETELQDNLAEMELQANIIKSKQDIQDGVSQQSPPGSSPEPTTTPTEQSENEWIPVGKKSPGKKYGTIGKDFVHGSVSQHTESSGYKEKGQGSGLQSSHLLGKKATAMERRDNRHALSQGNNHFATGF